MSLRAWLVGLLVVSAILSVEECRLRKERGVSSAAGLQASNAAAARDTTREISAVSLLGDSLKLYQRSVLQLSHRRDALDKALATERQASYRLSQVIDSVHLAAIATPSGHRARFAIRKAPFTIDAVAELPDPPDTLVHLDIGIALDTLRLALRLSCAPADAFGIRAASVEAIAPSWATIRFDDLEQDPELCANASVTVQPARSRVRIRPVIGFGRTVGPTSNWSFFAGVGITF